MFHRSERLLLRPGWIEDAPELAAQIADSGIVRSFAGFPSPIAEEHARTWLAQPVPPRHPRFLVTLPGVDGAAVIGACGIRPGRQAPELAWWIARDWWGQGFATEAVRATIKVAGALGHARLRARHALDNPASGRVLAKAGFRMTCAVTVCKAQGYGSEVLAREYEAVLAGHADDTDPTDMPRAA